MLVLRDVTERVESTRKLDQANDDLQILVEASLEFGASLNTADVLGAAAQRMRELSGAEQCDIYRLKDGRMQSLLTANGQIEQTESSEMGFCLADYDVSREAVESRQPRCVQDTAADPRLSAAERADAVRYGYRWSSRSAAHIGGHGRGSRSAHQRRAAQVRSARPPAGPRPQRRPGAGELADVRRAGQGRRTPCPGDSESSALFSSTLALDNVLVSSCRRLCEITEAPICSVYVLDDGALRCRAAVIDGEVDQVWMAQGFRGLNQWPTTPNRP